MSGEDQAADPAAILRGIADDSDKAKLALAPNARLLYVTWGAAWIVSFAALYLAFAPNSGQPLPLAAGLAVAAVAVAAAIVISTVHSARRGTGTRGPSVVQGAIFGNIYPVAFALIGLLGWRLTSAGVPVDVMLSYWMAGPCLVIGALSVAGAVLWNDRSQLVFGVWILVVGLGSLAVSPPHNLLAGVVGGVGFLVLAIIETAKPALTTGSVTSASHG
ncbi:hypothetical protein [Microbacterium sp. ZW T5_56]|uniref:hypothetical protein n=1 Tax=Microbacterium sp. ZW T5_56 TaxID=3378081 RepID=UPI003852C30C